MKKNNHNKDHNSEKEEVPAEPVLQEETVTLSKKDHEALLKKIEELEGSKDQFLRRAADLENSRKRLERDKEDFFKFANEKLIRELLPALDNLNRAIEEAEKADPDDAILKGIHLVEKHVFDVLQKNGVTRVESLGKPFSADFHEAIGEEETSKYPEGTVAEEFEAGYLLNGRVLRPARVKVAKAPASPEETKA